MCRVLKSCRHGTASTGKQQDVVCLPSGEKRVRSCMLSTYRLSANTPHISCSACRKPHTIRLIAHRLRTVLTYVTGPSTVTCLHGLDMTTEQGAPGQLAVAQRQSPASTAPPTSPAAGPAAGIAPSGTPPATVAQNRRIVETCCMVPHAIGQMAQHVTLPAGHRGQPWHMEHTSKLAFISKSVRSRPSISQIYSTVPAKQSNAHWSWPSQVAE
jgi:hypothetical protein